MRDDLFKLRERARAAVSTGDLAGAEAALVAAAQQTHVAEHDYVSVLHPLADVYARRGDPRSALTVLWYVDDAAARKDARALLDAVPSVDRARTLAAANDAAGAARALEDAGLVAAAAIHREKAGEWPAARALWSRLTGVVSATASAALAGTGTGAGTAARGGEAAYVAALVHFDLARAARKCGDPRQAREAIVAAVRLLEEAADHFESVGQRERAFDCFQVLAEIGKEDGSFENVLEGFVNCIRILREDHMKYFALQYLEDAIGAAKERGELSAAATLAREAAEYARSLGMPPIGVHYTLVQAELWKDLARQQIARGAPLEIAENAMLAALLAFGDAGRFTRVGALYGELGEMDLAPSRRAHYARAARRYEGIADEAVAAAPLPPHLRQENHFPDVWHDDVIEWEQRGSAAEACADVVLDRRWPDLTRRNALLARLTALRVDASPEPDGGAEKTAARARLAGELAQVQLYAILSPLEALFARPERAVKVAVLGAMQTLFFKRSFVTVRAALRDPDDAVVAAAAKAIESLYFQQAFDPLARIVREAPQAAVRASALRAMARVDNADAAEFLLGVLEHGAPTDRDAAVAGLRRARGAHFVDVARRALPTSPPPLADVLRQILRARGASA